MSDLLRWRWDGAGRARIPLNLQSPRSRDTSADPRSRAMRLVRALIALAAFAQCDAFRLPAVPGQARPSQSARPKHALQMKEGGDPLDAALARADAAEAKAAEAEAAFAADPTNMPLKADATRAAFEARVAREAANAEEVRLALRSPTAEYVPRQLSSPKPPPPPPPPPPAAAKPSARPPAPTRAPAPSPPPPAQKLELPKFEMPAELPKFEMPAEMPKFEMPAEMPKFEMPAEMPKFEMPAEMPKFETPAELPKISLPEVSLPQIELEGADPLAQFDAFLEVSSTLVG